MTADKTPIASTTNIVESKMHLSLDLPSKDGQDITDQLVALDKSVNHTDTIDRDSHIRTRSSNGISKKRVLKDAAEDGGILEPATPPKKLRVDAGKSAYLVQEYNSEHASDSDTLSQSSSPTTLSMSPLKLGTHMDGRDEFPPTLKDGSFLTQSKAQGKQKVVDIFSNSIEGINHELLFEPVKLAQEEEANMAMALFESKCNFDLASEKSQHTSSLLSSIATSSSVTTSSSEIASSSETMSSVIASTVALVSAPKARRTFKDVMPQIKATSPTMPMMTNGPLLQDDLMRFHVRSLPAKCQVTKTELQDPLLVDDYKSLPPLRSGSLVSWSSTASGTSAMDLLVLFSQWGTQCPTMDFDVACAAMRFERYKNFVNPCRDSPLNVNILFTSQDRRRSILQSNYKPAICLTPILSKESHLLTPVSFGLRNKFISGHLHQQEWQRFQGFTTMVFDKPSMVAQIYNNTISFTTTGALKAERDAASYSKNPRNPSIFSSSSGSGANLTKPKKIIAGAYFKTHLDYNDDIPIYDAREYPFNFASDLDDIDSVLPKFDEEIPPHSFVVVAYTMMHYEKENHAHLSTNVLFVILVGTE